MSAEISTTPKIEARIPKPLFKGPPGNRTTEWAPSGDGKRFLVLEDTEPALPPQIVLVLNWTAGLRQP
jgi:hypothetical protein